MLSPNAVPGSAHALLVEDDPVTREFLCETLLGAGWQVESAEDVGDAIAKARRRPPALVLCDLRLPDGDAFDVARLLGLDPGTGSAPRPFAVALSAELDAQTRASLHRAGFGIVLAKPVSVSDLLASLAGAPPNAQSSAGDDGERPVLDDDDALSVCGDVRTVETLRALLATELPAALAAIRDAARSGDHARLAGTLHRLRSASGFCGATAFSAALAKTHMQARGNPISQDVAHVLAQGEALLQRLAIRSGG